MNSERLNKEIETTLSDAPNKLWFKFFVVLLIIVLPSFFYLITPGFGDHDSYYFFGKVCGFARYDYTVVPTLAFEALNHLPCDEFLLKLLSIAFLIASTYMIYSIVELFAPKHGFLGVLLAGITNVFVFRHFVFENDIFAYPIIFLSLYLFLRYLKNNRENKTDLIASLTLLAFSFFFWGGGIFYIFGFALMEPLLIPIVLIVTFLHGNTLLNSFLPRFEIVENNPIMRLWNYIFYGIIFLLGIKNQEAFNWFFPRLTIFFFLIGLINPKFIILAIPFFSLTLVKVYKTAPQNAKNNMILAMLGFAIVWPSFIIVHGLEPRAYEHQAAQDIVDYAKQNNLEIANDWTYGHLINFYGGKTNQHSGPGDYNLFKMPNKAILTGERLPCKIVKQYEPDYEINSPLTLYQC